MEEEVYEMDGLGMVEGAFCKSGPEAEAAFCKTEPVEEAPLEWEAA